MNPNHRLEQDKARTVWLGLRPTKFLNSSNDHVVYAGQYLSNYPILIVTDENEQGSVCQPGDWLIANDAEANGGVYPCDEDVFDETDIKVQQ